MAQWPKIGTSPAEKPHDACRNARVAREERAAAIAAKKSPAASPPRSPVGLLSH